MPYAHTLITSKTIRRSVRPCETNTYTVHTTRSQIPICVIQPKINRIYVLQRLKTKSNIGDKRKCCCRREKINKYICRVHFLVIIT